MAAAPWCSLPWNSPVGARREKRGAGCDAENDGLGCSTEATERDWREHGVMTMYLSNRDVRPTGYEPGEFIESPPVPDEIDAEDRALTEAPRPGASARSG